ncbi:MAG: PKD domain-containing protein [Candidatus Tenebribacter davisii]|nr:PKD domain-containing protein [Candidatus Tenebribacter davisii]
MKFILSVLFLLSLTIINAVVINVPADQPTIQYGIEFAANSDTVLVQPGTYYENINYNGKLITVGSLFLTTRDTTYISSTIIDGQDNGRVINFTSGENNSSTLYGLTIRNGNANGASFPGNSGGGILCDNVSSPTIKNVIIRDNSADLYGGGIFCNNNCDVILMNVEIVNNSAQIGGGITYYDTGSPLLQDSSVSGNTASSSAGGIYFISTTPTLVNVLLADNQCDWGAALSISYSDIIMQHVTITGNHGSGGGGGIYCYNSHPQLTNSIMWNNLPQEIFMASGEITISYTDIQGSWAGTGNINSNPLFVDAANGDYHLQPGSPCIDAGNPASPLDPDNSITDMGAYFCTQYPPPVADFMATVICGGSPLTEYFFDASVAGMGVISEWYWDFGDGSNSSLQNPSHEYLQRGDYTVSLTVTDEYSSTDIETKIDYISVVNSPPFVQNPIEDFSFEENTSNSTLDLNNVFSDVDLLYGDELTFNVDGNNNIAVSINEGTVTLTPAPDWFGYEDITFIATDDSLVSMFDQVQITIDNVNEDPVINAYDPDQVEVTINEAETQIFWVSVSDVEGDILNYEWYVDEVLQSGQTDSIYTYTSDYNSAGIYQIKCLINDEITEIYDNFSSNASSIKFAFRDNREPVMQEWQLTVINVDQEIVVNDLQPPAGAIAINEMETINFMIDAVDPDGNPLEYSWKLNGTEVSIITTYDFTTDYTSAGNYQVTLDVTDNFSENSLNYNWNVSVVEVDQEIVVNDLQPPAGDVTINEIGTINFTIDAVDPDGNTLDYSWKLDGTEVSIIATYDFTTDYTSAGNYQVTLDVTDNFSDNSLNYNWNVSVVDVDLQIVVNDLQPPAGDVTINEIETINFTIDAVDPDGNTLDYSWKLDGTEVSIIATYDFTTDYTSAGNYQVTLDVTDNFNDRLESSRSELNYSWNITVNNIDQFIVVNDIEPAPGPVVINEMEMINFLIDAFDPDGNPLEYIWQLDEVEVSTEVTYTFEGDYTSAGEYLVTLDVTDNFSDNEINYAWNVTVNDVDQEIVVNDLQPAPGPVVINEMEMINFLIDAFDPDGNPLEYSWKLDGVEVFTLSSYYFITDENSAGDYEVTLYITDNFETRDELNFLWNITVNDVSGLGEVLIPVITRLEQNYPNPFNPITNIQFDIKENETGILTIFNMKGQNVVSQTFSSGRHNYLWNAAGCSSGVYFYKLQTSSLNETKKMLLLK